MISGREWNPWCPFENGRRTRSMRERPVVDANRSRRGWCSRRLCMCCEPVASGKLCRRSASAAPARSTSGFWNGSVPACSRRFGQRGWRNTTRWKVSPGDGKVLMGPYSRLHWHKSRSGPTRPIGEKNGSKRHLLVDGRGVPLSFIVTGANRHDVTQLDAVLSAIMIKREVPAERRSKHLCLDAGYRGQPALEIIERHGYIPHVASRTQEKKAKQQHPGKKARRWVVEVCHHR